MKVFYRCEGEMGRVAEARDLGELLRDLHEKHVPASTLKTLVKNLREHGGFQGEHDHGRFSVVKGY